ncbi:hypothetical protein H1R20_g3391, partial [Candolleomyces eurysporus]
MNDDSLFNSIPIELMCEIFSSVTFLDSLSLSTYPFHIPASHRAPLLLTKVCSQWRNIVLKTPTLWSSLAIDMERILGSEPKRTFYRFWLDRAWGTPISLYIIDVRRSDAALLKNHNDWIDFLLDNAPHIKHLLTGPHVFNALLHALSFKPDHRNSRTMIGGRLEGISCVFNATDSLHYPFYDQTSIIFPNLRQVDIASTSYKGFADLQIHKLTHLSANFSLLEFLQSNPHTLTFPKLIELYLYPPARTLRQPPKALDESHRFVFPELQFLKIFDPTEGLPDTRRILPHFECPKLDTLQIENLNPMMKLNQTDRLHSTGDFEFFAKFLETTSRSGAGIKYFVTRHRDFLDKAFFDHPTVRSGIEFVQVMMSTKNPSRSLSNYYYWSQLGWDTHALAADGTVPTDPAARTEAQKRSFANTWKAHGLEVVFSTDSKAYIGWSRIRGRALGKSFVKSWAAAFWDKAPYVECIEQSRGAELIPY